MLPTFRPEIINNQTLSSAFPPHLLIPRKKRHIKDKLNIREIHLGICKNGEHPKVQNGSQAKWKCLPAKVFGYQIFRPR